MIIKLTEMRKDGPITVHVNMDHVQYFSKSMNGSDTRLKIYGDSLYLFVKESAEEIVRLTHYKPSIIFDADTGKVLEVS